MSARFLREDGTEIDRRIVSRACNMFREIYQESYANPKSNLQASLLPGIGKTLLTIDEKERNDTKCAFEAMLNHVRFHEGDEIDNISLEDGMSDIPGGDLHIPGGYKQLLDDLEKGIPESALKYNSEIININWANSEDDLVNLKTRDGRKFEANHVIITCPLGYLKKHKNTLFDPALPSPKSNIVETMGFGTVNKIFMEFEKPVLKPVNVGIAFAWENTNEKIDSCNWYKRLFGFDAVFTRPNVILGWISGDGARAMEGLSDSQIKNTCLDLLRKFLNDSNIPVPVNFIVSRWHSNPYTLGSYSYHTPSIQPKEIQTLAEPLTNKDGVPVLLFAGEATHADYYGCTHAARDSGIREAERIIQIISAAKSKL